MLVVHVYLKMECATYYLGMEADYVLPFSTLRILIVNPLVSSLTFYFILLRTNPGRLWHQLYKSQILSVVTRKHIRWYKGYNVLPFNAY